MRPDANISVKQLNDIVERRLRSAAGWLRARDLRARELLAGSLVGSAGAGLTVNYLARHRAFFLILPLWICARYLLERLAASVSSEDARAAQREVSVAASLRAISDALLVLPFAALAPSRLLGALVVGLVLFDGITVAGTDNGGRWRFDPGLRALVIGVLALWFAFGRNAGPESSGLVVIGTLAAFSLMGRWRGA